MYLGIYGISWDLRKILINAKKKVGLLLLNLAAPRLRNGGIAKKNREIARKALDKHTKACIIGYVPRRVLAIV